MLRRLRSGSFLNAVLVLVSGTAIAQALPILMMPVISRMFSPDDFGVLGLFTAFIGFGTTFIALSFPLAIVSNVPRLISARLVVISLAITIPMATIAAVALFVFRSQALLGFEALPAVAPLLAWAVFIFIGVFVTLRYWQVREDQYRRISSATIAQSVGRVATQLVVGLLSLGGTGLLVSEFVARLMGVSTLAKSSLRNVADLVKGSRLSNYLADIREFRKFPLLSTPSSMLDSLSIALPIPLLTTAYGLAVSGQFSMAYRSLALPVAVVSAAVADVFHRQIAEAAGTSMEHAQRLFWKVGIVLLLAGLLPSIVVGFWGPALFEVVLGAQWRQSGAIASGIIPWLLATFVVGPLSRVVLVFRGQEIKLVYDVLALASVVGSIQYGQFAGYSVESTARLLGVTQTCVYAVYFLLLWHIVRSHASHAKSQDDQALSQRRKQ